MKKRRVRQGEIFMRAEQQSSGVLILHTGKECNYRTGGEMETILEDYSGEELTVIGINCEGMTFIDSIGLGGLIRVYRDSEANDVKFVVYGLSAVMEELFSKNKWDRIFKPLSKQEFEQTYSGERKASWKGKNV
ncbi:MAG: STAS domain-containing protein [bacterium]|nr:STAS domain-containing protein [bacterium]